MPDNARQIITEAERASKFNAGSEATKRAADRHAALVVPSIDDIRASGITALSAIARELNAREVRTARGGEWHAMTVRNLLRRVANRRRTPMTRSDIVSRLFEANPHLERSEAETVVNIFFGEIAAALSRGERAELRGFGSFSVKRRDARAGRNPHTGAPVDVAAKTFPVFKHSKLMGSRLNGATTSKD
jgi:integration host factor subunit beta